MYDVQFIIIIIIIIIVRPINQHIACNPSNSKLVEQTWVYMAVVMLLLLWCSVVIGYCNCITTVVVTKLLSLLLTTNILST